MTIHLRSALLGAAALLAFSASAKADCGEVTITEMNWASASVVTAVSKFLMEEGYGCAVTVVPSDTIPAVTSVAETGKPDIITELWINSAPKYLELEAEGKVETLGAVLSDGGIRNAYTVRILNKRTIPRNFAISVDGLTDPTVEVTAATGQDGDQVVTVAADQTREVRVIVSVAEPPACPTWPGIYRIANPTRRPAVRLCAEPWMSKTWWSDIWPGARIMSTACESSTGSRSRSRAPRRLVGSALSM